MDALPNSVKAGPTASGSVSLSGSSGSSDTDTDTDTDADTDPSNQVHFRDRIRIGLVKMRFDRDFLARNSYPVPEIRVAAGAEMINGQWRAVTSLDAERSGALPEVTFAADASAEVGFGLAGSVVFYNVVGPTVTIGPFLRFEGAYQTPPPELEYFLYGGLKASGSIDVSILDWLSVSWTLVERELAKWTLLHGRVSIAGAPSVSSFSINDGASSTSSRNVTLDSGFCGFWGHHT